MKTIMWDVDTQRDFIQEDGALYVEGSEEIRDNLGKITRFAREEGHPIFGSIDYHEDDDEEISENPDFEETFPPHCLKDTDGWKKIKETQPENPLWIDSKPLAPDQFEQTISEHDGEIYLRKQRFDVFSNPNTEPILELADPFQIAVYGVTLDVCVQRAIEGFLDRDYQVTLIEDATRALEESNRSNILFDWKNLGVQVVNTEDALSGYLL